MTDPFEFEIDMSGARQLYSWVENFDERYDDFLRRFLRSVANEALRRTIERTPVGHYSADSGMQGGSLRRAWKLSKIRREGAELVIDLYADNLVAPYAVYVEEGHRLVPGLRFQLPDGSWRTTNKVGWWEGYHMARISIEEVEQAIPAKYAQAFARFIRIIDGVAE